MSHTIDKEFLEICQNIKKPLKFANMYSTVMEQLRKQGFDGRDLSSAGYQYKTDDLLDKDLYAKEISIVSSGNEPKVYAYVTDSNDKFLYNACYLADTPEAYALVAKYAGAFMEAFNDYMTYINVK